MQGNDLANIVVPRYVLVWEGLLGLLPDTKIQAAEAKFREKGKWDQALACYQINEMLARKIWDQVFRHSIEIDLLTYLGDEFAEALVDRIERENIPVREVYYREPDVLARSLVYEPNILVVYDPYPEHQFLFGAKGHILLPDDYQKFGVQ